MKRVSLLLVAFLIVMLFLPLYQTPKVKANPDLIDSYSEANKNYSLNIPNPHPTSLNDPSAFFQSFKPTQDYTLTSCKWWLIKIGLPTGNCHAVLYAHTGTFGSDGKPTGSALATSDDFDISTIGTSYALVEFTFTGGEQYSLQGNTPYCITYENPSSGVNSSNKVYAGIDTSSPTHEGNGGYYNLDAWSNQAWDACFYVYGDAVGVGEYTEEFTNTIGISASLYLWKALFYTQTETITVTSTSYLWREYPCFFTETTTITEQLNQWNELRRFFTETITPTEQMNTYRALFRLFQETISPTETSSFTMELALVITEFVETVGVDASLSIWKARQIFFEETVNPTANFYKWISLTDIFTETIGTTEQPQFLKEKLFYRTETINISDSFTALAETLLTIIEFTDTILFNADMYLTLPITPTAEEEVSTFGTVSLIIAIIALAIAVTAFTAKKR